jgi:hypothetical protein
MYCDSAHSAGAAVRAVDLSAFGARGRQPACADRVCGAHARVSERAGMSVGLGWGEVMVMVMVMVGDVGCVMRMSGRV